MSPRDCPRFERLVDLARGELSPGEAENARAHISLCAACQEEIDEIRSLLAASRAGGIEPPADFPARVLRALRASGKGRCGIVPLRLLEHLKGELEGEEAARVSAHVEACGACRADLREIHAVLMRVRTLPDVEAPAGFADRVLAVARERRASVRTVRSIPTLRPAPAGPRIHWFFLPAAAAACALLAVGAWWALRPARPPSTVVVRPPPPETVPIPSAVPPPPERIVDEPDPIGAFRPGPPLALERPDPEPFPPEPLALPRGGVPRRVTNPKPGPAAEWSAHSPGPSAADFPLAVVPSERAPGAARGRGDSVPAMVAGGLDWIASQQGSRGEFALPGVTPGSLEEAETTALALLPLLRDRASGENPLEGRHRRVVRQGLDYLLSCQDAEGRFAGGRARTQGLCLLAVSEGALAAADVRILGRLEQSLPISVASGALALQRTRLRTGGFADARGPADPVVSAWAGEALARADDAAHRWPTARIRVSPEGAARDASWLKSLPDVARGRVGRIEDARWPLFTAAALHAWRALGAHSAGTSPFESTPALLVGERPAWPDKPEVAPDLYLQWYFAAHALRFEPKADRDKWGRAALLVLIDTRCKASDPGIAGSWPNRSVPYGQASFRVYATAMSVLILQALETY